MNKISVNQEKSKRTGVKFSFQSMLMLMAAIMMALVTLTACPVDDENEDDPDEIENGENGGVAGKRIITQLITWATGEIAREEYSYNSDGSLKQIDQYDAASRLVQYSIFTNNPDGTHAKYELYTAVGNTSNLSLNQTCYYSYDANKKPQKGEVTFHLPEMQNMSMTFVFSFENGRKVREVISMNDVLVQQFDFSYDNRGKRTKTTETHFTQGTRNFTRTYNSDGTLQKVTAEAYSNYQGSEHTQTFTWENGKTTVNYDDYDVY